MPAFSVPGLRDAAGAGDWCTAGLLSKLIADRKKLEDRTKEEIEDALRLGQAFAAVNCRYEGARGSMYVLSKKQFDAAVADVLKGESLANAEEEDDSEDLRKLLRALCPSCDTRPRQQLRLMSSKHGR